MGGASQSQLKCFLFEQHSTPKLSDVRKEAPEVEIKEEFTLRSLSCACVIVYARYLEIEGNSMFSCGHSDYTVRAA